MRQSIWFLGSITIPLISLFQRLPSVFFVEEEK